MLEPSNQASQEDVCLHCGQPEYRHSAQTGYGRLCPVAGCVWKSRATFEAAIRADQDRITREECAESAVAWLHTPTLKLRAGEMSAQEVRTVKVVVAAIVQAIRNTEDL